MFALSLLVIAPALAGSPDRVPQDYASIQAAVDKGTLSGLVYMTLSKSTLPSAPLIILT
jgi:hypothetical protein